MNVMTDRILCEARRPFFSCLMPLASCLLCFLCHCGGGGADAPITSEARTGGAVQLVITGTKAAAVSARTQVATYRVVVSGPGFDPLTTVFDGTATDGTIAGIPVGDDRHVFVTALNVDDEAVREGEARDVVVPADDVAQVPITMEVVPLFANLRADRVVPNSRLRFELQGAPGHPLAVLAGTTAEGGDAVAAPNLAPLVDAALNLRYLPTDATTGLVTLAPNRLPPGRYQFVVRDQLTGRQSTVAVLLTDGTKARGAPLVTAGRDATQAGGIFTHGTKLPRTTWPLVVQQWTK